MDEDEKNLKISAIKSGRGSELKKPSSFEKQAADIEFIDFMAREYSNVETDIKVEAVKNTK